MRNSNSIRVDNPIRLSFDRPQFKTEGNTITCRLNYAIVNNPRYNFDEMTGAFVSGVKVGDVKGSARTRSSVGVARCSANDEFDKTTGRRIAQARAEAAAYADARNLVRSHRAMLMRAISETDEFIDKASGVITHNKSFVNAQGN